MKFKTICFSLLLLLATVLTGCGKESGLLLHLPFDEGSGNLVTDAAGRQAEVSYLLTNTPYNTPQDPQWRSQGVEGGCLLFDGCSNFISFSPEEVLVAGDAFSVSLWVAPRMFEWDDPNAANHGDPNLTALVGQYNQKKNQGFLLGYQRFGRLCFQVGTGEEWITLWADGNLRRYQWNHVAAEFDGKQGKISLLLNGEVVGSTTVPAGSAIAPAERENLLVGKNAKGEAIAAGTYNMVSGLMDEVKLYGRLLPEEERSPKAAPEIAYADIALQNVLTEDIYKTQYHGGPYQHWMNEPHAPVYYNGMYHLFFQQNITGTYWRNICWGHLVSEDLVSWRPVKEAIVPMEDTVVPDGVWSGGATLDKNGVPLLFFTAGNDSFRQERMLSNQNIGVAYPADLTDPELIDWVICEELAIEQQAGQGRPGEFRDPHIWKEGDSWYLLLCSGSLETDGGSALLYVSDTLELLPDGTVDMNWIYKGPVYEMEDPSITFGTSWELPILLPFANEAGTITRYAFFFSPAPASVADNKVYYFLGDFDKDTGKFTPDPAYGGEPALLDYGSNVFTGPSMFVDPVSGNTYCFSIMQDQRTGAEEGAAGWAHCVGLTRRLWLSDDGSDLCMAPIEALKNLEGPALVELENATLEEANEALAAVEEDMLVLRLDVDVSQAESVTLNLKSGGEKDGSTFAWKREGQSISATTRNRGKAAKTGYVSGPLTLAEDTLSVVIYIDRSLVEAFFNDSKSISLRSYAAPTSTGISLEAEGTVVISSLTLAPMASIYE